MNGPILHGCDSYIHSYLYITINSHRCLQLDFLHQKACAQFTLATDFYIYRYTSYENFTEFAMTLDQLRSFVDFSEFCEQFATYFICNYVFTPCDLTTGAPRPICTDTCYFFRTYCSDTYSSMIRFAAAVKYPIMDNCENTLAHLQLGYNFPCSSSSLQNDCIDIDLTSTYVAKFIILQLLTFIYVQ